MLVLQSDRAPAGRPRTSPGRALIWAALGLLLVATGVTLVVLRPWARIHPPRILIVGIDGADWRAIRPLLAAGELPHLTGLIQQGAHGPLWGMPPLTPPVGWTSIATGRPPDQHGVLGFTSPDPRTGRPDAITGGLRRTKAFWNILSDHGITVGLVGWWATGPAEPVEGVVVSDRVLGHPFLPAPTATTGAIHPVERDAQIRALIDRIRPPSLADAQRFLDVSAGEYGAASELDPADPIGQFRRIHRDMRATAEIARFVQRRDRPEVLAVCFDGIDAAGHLYGSSPEPAESPAAPDAGTVGGALRGFYRLQDDLLGELLELTDAATTIVVLSPYGSRADAGRRPIDHALASRSHRPDGILLMKGPRVRQRTGERDPAAVYDRAGSLDVLPTLLALLGLPVPEDLPGRVLTDMLAADFAAPSRISTYEDEAWQRDRVAARPDYNGLDEAERARLRSLGYTGIDDPTGVFCQRDHEALAEFYTVTGRAEQAEQELRALIAAAPADADPYYRLGSLGLRRKAIGEARALFEQALALDAKHVESRMGLAFIYREQGDRPRALALLEEGARLHPGHAGLRVNLGMLHSEAGDTAEARRLFEEALRIHPDHHTAHVQLATLLEREGAYEEALAHWREATRLRPDDRLARDHVSLVERHLGESPGEN